MSITFHPALQEGDISGWEISCYIHEGGHPGQYPSYEAATEAYQELLGDTQVTPGECLIIPVWGDELTGAEVNMSATTAHTILKACGIDVETESWITGSRCPTEMLSRLLMAGAVLEPAHAGAGVGTRNPAGAAQSSDEPRLSRRRSALIDLCIVCIRLGREITWA